MAKAIRAIQGIKYEKKYAEWSHVATVVGHEGELVESLMLKGVIKSNLNDYLDDLYIYINIQALFHDRWQMRDFALSCVNKPYGWLNALSIMLTMFVDSAWLTFGGTSVCSTLAAQALCRGDFIFDRDPNAIRPANIAERFLT